MATMVPAGLQAVANANGPQLAVSNALSGPAGASAAASVRNLLQDGRDNRAAALPAPSTQVNISENGRARLQAEQANAAAMTPTTQTAATPASQAVQTAPGAPVASVGAAPDTRNDTMLTATAPAAPAAGGAPVSGQGTPPADPMAAAAPAPGTPRAEAGRQQTEAAAVQAQAQQSDNRANQQDVSPVVAQSGVATNRGVFSN
ncbi:MAG: hypothetical protein LBI31_05220 [Zoogloeaceae bacterium]|jgi:hypothetical protein|nr:hypothetical protein [Zoogloeaceae bacterium]